MRVVVTPVGDARGLGALVKALEEQRPSFDEWHLWPVGGVPEAGVQELRALAAATGAWVVVREPKQSAALHHRQAVDKRVVYFRVDHRVTWLAPGFFDALAAAVQPGVLAAHANSVADAAVGRSLALGDVPAARAACRLAEPVVCLGRAEGAWPELRCFAWSGRTFGLFGGAVGKDERAFLLRDAAAYTGFVNVAVSDAVCFTGPLPQPVAPETTTGGGGVAGAGDGEPVPPPEPTPPAGATPHGAVARVVAELGGAAAPRKHRRSRVDAPAMVRLA